jgi:outer membrane protein assembly factor BamB
MAYQGNLLSKTLVIGIIFLFVVMNIIPSIAVDTVNIEYVQHQDTCSSNEEWPMFHHDPQNTGYSTSIAPQKNNILWTYTVGFDISSSPAVIDGKVYIGSADEVFYCLDADNGLKLWDYPVPGGTGRSSPAVFDGKVYVATTYYNIFCWDADTGELIWKYPKEYGVSSSPVVVDDKVYIGVGEYSGGKIYCLNASTGEKIWSFIIGGNTQVSSSPAVADGRVYIGSLNNRLYCLNADNGSKLWEFDTCWMVLSSPAIADGKVYIGGGGLYCLDADSGNKLWYFHGRTLCSPAVAYGSIYFVGQDGKVYCVDAESGDELWNYTSGADANSVPSPVVADGKVYVNICRTGKLICFDAGSGNKLWDYQICVPDWLLSTPTIAYGRVYIGGGLSCKVYCFEDPSKPPETPIIKGQTSGKTGKEYEYTFNATDSDGDDVKYLIDWGDNTTYETDFNVSGTYVMVKHVWSEDGTFNITAKAQDIYGLNSSEGTLTVKIPRYRATVYSLFQLFFDRFPLLEVFLRTMNLLR